MRHCNQACPRSSPGLTGKTDLMPVILRPLVLIVPLAILAACDQAEAPGAPTDKRAEGEVLGGTISDAMVPLDQVRSQAPPLRVAPEEGDEAGTDGEANDAAAPADPAPEAESEPAPAAPAEEG